jgi:hypothetical protein
MSSELPDDVRRAVVERDGFEVADGEVRVTSTVFDARLDAETVEWKTVFSVTVSVPSLSAAVDGEVGGAVASGWLETFERRLADAPSSTRATVELDELDVVEVDGEVVVTFAFAFGDEARGVEVAKTFVEYVEGTYVEGIVPGYDYVEPVSTLLGEATQSGGGPGSGTPL